jgi:hypothetical protein
MKDAGSRTRNTRGVTNGLRHALRVLLILHPAVLLFSCASVPELPWSPVARDVSAGFYDTARLEYRLDAGKMGQPLDVVRVDGRQVAFEQIASSPLADRSIGTLVIQQPHPAGREGFARVTFSIDSAQASASSSSALSTLIGSGGGAAAQIGNHEEVHEVWAMDLPKADADRYFKLLSEQNFFQTTPPETAPAQLAATLDGKEVRKNWELVPDLNALAQQVRREGQLVAYLRPQALAGEPTRSIASVQAYRELLAKTGHPASTTSQPSAGVLKPQDSVASGKQPYASR